MVTTQLARKANHRVLVDNDGVIFIKLADGSYTSDHKIPKKNQD